MSMKTCIHCGIQFQRLDAAPIPNDRCKRCHEEVKWMIDRVSHSGAGGDHYTKPRSKYHREIKPGVFVDVYDVLAAWAVDNPALQHLIKKALQPGGRGHKTREQDMADIVSSAKRAQELEQ